LKSCDQQRSCRFDPGFEYGKHPFAGAFSFTDGLPAVTSVVSARTAASGDNGTPSVTTHDKRATFDPGFEYGKHLFAGAFFCLPTVSPAVTSVVSARTAASGDNGTQRTDI
ncbi:MAG: hypothetical protein K2J51_07005, partial [Alistipes sp.]|nr:hypothetical protein [Alistipes sp.]